jgi:hypothetical protein
MKGRLEELMRGLAKIRRVICRLKSPEKAKLNEKFNTLSDLCHEYATLSVEIAPICDNPCPRHDYERAWIIFGDDLLDSMAAVVDYADSVLIKELHRFNSLQIMKINMVNLSHIL